MQNSTKYPATIREAGDMAAKLDMKLSEFLDMIGPIPQPPAGYTLAQGSSTRWIGHEIVNRGWIVTPTWNARTGRHSIEVWMADHHGPTYAPLTPVDALQLAADLTAAATAGLAAAKTSGDTE